MMIFPKLWRPEKRCCQYFQCYCTWHFWNTSVKSVRICWRNRKLLRENRLNPKGFWNSVNQIFQTKSQKTTNITQRTRPTIEHSLKGLMSTTFQLLTILNGLLLYWKVLFRLHSTMRQWNLTTFHLQIC